MKPDRLLRAFDVLELLSGNRGALRMSEVSDALKLPVSSTHNLLKAMTDAELISMDAERRYRIGARAIRLGIRLVEGIAVRELGRPYFRALVDEIGYDVYIAMRMGDDVIYVDRFEGNHPVSIEIRVGQKLYLHATAVGKLFAAFHDDLRAIALSGPLPGLTPSTITDVPQLEAALDEIGVAGFSLSDGEGVEGIRGLAVPIRDGAGGVAAAIHISVVQAAAADDGELLAAAMSTAKRVEHELGLVSDRVP